MGLTEYFDALVTPEDTTNHKPHKEPAIKAMEKINAEKSKTLFVGDAEYDIKCAENANIDSYLVTY